MRCARGMHCTEHAPIPKWPAFRAGDLAGARAAAAAQPAQLLDDAAVATFLTDGLLVLPPDPVVPAALHAHCRAQLVRLGCGGAAERNKEKHERGRNPGNNVLSAVPALYAVMEAPTVHCAFD